MASYIKQGQQYVKWNKITKKESRWAIKVKDMKDMKKSTKYDEMKLLN